MTYEQLTNFVANDMRMMHVYQPVMLRELLLSPAGADVETIARAILAHDRSQIEYYEDRVKQMVGEVLTDREIVTKLKHAGRIVGYRIVGGEELTDPQRKALIGLCEEKIDQFVEENAGDAWRTRLNNERYIPGSIRYDVLRRARRRCELCGISADDAPLQVDHIVPKTWGGSDDISNFQALCSTCNANKGNRGDQDFRGIPEQYEARKVGCPFCNVGVARVIDENELCVVIPDLYPVSEGHRLIIPKRHVEGYFDLFQPELNALHQLATRQRDQLKQEDGSITGFNIGANHGEAAGQTVMHCHVHLIPRREGDTPDPRGGVRGVIPAKQSY